MLPKKYRRDRGKNGIVGSEPTVRVWLNGTFDVLHAGHIHLFQHAKTLYPHSYVRVGVDTDERVGRLKGDNRPINTLHNRMKVLKSIRYIDEVVSFNSDNELRAEIALYNPHIMCIGDDYQGRTIIGEEFIPRVIYVERYDGLSTSGIVNR